MCGRFTLFVGPDELEERFGVDVPAAYEPSYNVAPGEEIPVIADDAPETLSAREWGLVPSWADEPDDGHINARAETVEDRPSFREAVARRRCLIPADGFYEWTDEEGGRQPYRIAFEDDRPFAMAGIWERWEGTQPQVGLDAFGDGGAEPGHDVRETVAILTTEAAGPVADLHDRMPVILPRERERAWLAADDPADRTTILAPFEHPDFRAYRVSQAVNDPGNDRPDLVEAVGG